MAYPELRLNGLRIIYLTKKGLNLLEIQPFLKTLSWDYLIINLRVIGKLFPN